jgi:LysM repeat protein
VSPRPRRGRRDGLARYLAPAAFLLAATIAALLIRSGFERGGGGSAGPVTVPSIPATTAKASTGVTTTTAATTTGAARYYTIKSGDTLQQIALDQGTTVERLLELNPKVDPASLTVGQRLRVG